MINKKRYKAHLLAYLFTKDKDSGSYLDNSEEVLSSEELSELKEKALSEIQKVDLTELREDLKEDSHYLELANLFTLNCLAHDSLLISPLEAKRLFFEYWLYTEKDTTLYSMGGVVKDLKQVLEYHYNNKQIREAQQNYLAGLLKDYILRPETPTSKIIVDLLKI